MTEIAYHPVMGVVRMAIDVREWSFGQSCLASDARPPLEVIPLMGGFNSPAHVAAAVAVAAACGLRPAGFAGEIASRPGRIVDAWLAFDRPGPAAGVVLLQTSTPIGGGDARISIPWLLVRPERRRLGVGRALVGAAVDRARGIGGVQISIDTLDRWPEALAFWKRLGFRAT